MSAAGVALMLGGAGILLAASPAQAAEVAYKTECIPPPISGLPPVQGTTKVEITAPAQAKVGDEVEVVWKFVEAASKNPDILDLEKDTVKPTGTLKAAGAQTVNIAMEGPRSNPPIPKNSPMKLSDMKGKIKLTTAGEVTLTPDAYNINVSKPMSTDTKCTPKETVKAAATIKVTDGGGSTSGGTTSGGSTSGGSTSGGSTSGGGGGQTDFPGKEVTVTFECKSPGPADINSKVTINAKKNGGSYDLVVKTAKGVMNSPAALPAGALKPSMAVLLGGADKGTVPVTGPANKDPLEQGKPVDLPDMTGTYKPGAAWQVHTQPRHPDDRRHPGRPEDRHPVHGQGQGGSLTRTRHVGPAGRRVGRLQQWQRQLGWGHIERRHEHERRPGPDGLRQRRRPARPGPGRGHGDPAGRRGLHVHPVAQAARDALERPRHGEGPPHRTRCGGPCFTRTSYVSGRRPSAS